MLIGLSDVLASGEIALQELADTVAASLAQQLGDACVICLLSEGGRWLEPLAVADPDPEKAAVLAGLVGARVPADRGFTRHVLASVATLRLPQLPPDVVLLGRPELSIFAQRYGIRSVIVAPLRVQGRAIGHLTVIRHRENRPHDAQEERFVQLVAEWLALAIQCGSMAGAEPETRVTGTLRPLDLSHREREILALVALGHTNREIAEQLVLSVRTIEWHRSRIQWKLGVTGRAALARVAREHGLIG